MGRELWLTLFCSTPACVSANDLIDVGCPVTRTEMYSLGTQFPSVDSWFGNEVLAIKLPTDSSFSSTNVDGPVMDVLEFWSNGYQLGSEFRLAVTGRLIGTQLNTDIVKSRGAYRDSDGNWIMSLGIEFADPGCWKLTAEYYGERISAFVRVTRN